MPTACDRINTSSGPMSGSSMSATTASFGAWKIRAFMALLGSCRDQHLATLRRLRRQALEGRLGLVHAQPAGYDALDREAPGRDLCGDPRPVVDAIAPAADDLQVVQRPEHGIDLAAA